MERDPVLRPQVQRRGARLGGLIAVLLLHIPPLAGLLYVNLAGDKRQSEVPQETTLVLLPERALKAAPDKAHGGNAAGAINAPLPQFVSPSGPSTQALSIGQALFGCRPENLRDLTVEQQEKCLKFSANRYVAMKDGLPIYIKPPGPAWEGLSNSDLRARERNTADPCAIAKMGKMATAECYHDITHEKGLW